MVMSNSLLYQNRSSSVCDLFDKINQCKSTYFYKSEVYKYVNIGAVTCTNITGNKYHIKSNTDNRSVDIILK